MTGLFSSHDDLNGVRVPSHIALNAGMWYERYDTAAVHCWRCWSSQCCETSWDITIDHDHNYDIELDFDRDSVFNENCPEDGCS